MYKRGAIPSPPDARDYTIAPSAIPRAVDYEWYARKPKIGKQKQSNCANAAIGYAAESVTGIPMTWGAYMVIGSRIITRARAELSARRWTLH